MSDPVTETVILDRIARALERIATALEAQRITENMILGLTEGSAASEPLSWRFDHDNNPLLVRADGETEPTTWEALRVLGLFP